MALGFFASLALFMLAAKVDAARAPQSAVPKFEVSFPAAAHSGAITGRAFVLVSQQDTPEPRIQVGGFGDSVAMFGADVNVLAPGQAVVMDAGTLGYPTRSLRDIPTGEYYVQALVNIYTQFHRSDGHTIWAHMDQWEGQQFNLSPGNLYSEVETVHLDAQAGYDVKLTLARVIPPVDVPPDTEWVKRIKIQSKLLTEFWGHPMYLGAVVLLPRGYETHPDVSYPVLYEQGHFSLAAPFGFRTEPSEESEALRRARQDPAFQTGYDFYQAWNSDNFPRMIISTFQHPTPFFDDSYAVNSANNGPYGDAIMTELIPYIEAHFRTIRKPHARVLAGGSTGGWESLALQVYHSDFFGGTWTFFPDPVDFRRYDLVDIYEDDNAFTAPRHEWLFPEIGR